MVEKLKKYNVEMCYCVFGEHMVNVEHSDGEFFKVEDVEAILNSAQQLKAEIAALIDDFDTPTHLDGSFNLRRFINQLRQLSAV